MHYVYLLRSEKDNSNYIGQTANISSRVKRHNDGKVESTKNKRPWALVKFEEYGTRSEAMWREHILKNSSQERKKFYK